MGASPCLKTQELVGREAAGQGWVGVRRPGLGPDATGRALGRRTGGGGWRARSGWQPDMSPSGFGAEVQCCGQACAGAAIPRTSQLVRKGAAVGVSPCRWAGTQILRTLLNTNHESRWTARAQDSLT